MRAISLGRMMGYHKPPMKLYHTTTLEGAEIIKRQGFRDNRGSYGLSYENGTPFYISGVFFSDRPLDCNDGLSQDVSQVFVIEIPCDVIDPYELVEEGKGYREWCIPTVVVNKYFTEREPLNLKSLLWGLEESPGD